MILNNKKIMINFLEILFLFVLTSCTTKFGGINGDGIKLSIGYILCNSVIGSIILCINCGLLLVFGGKDRVHDMEVYRYDFSIFALIIISIFIFLFIFPFIYSPIPNGKYNLFWLKSATSSFIICILCVLFSESKKINNFDLFISIIAITTIEIIGLVYNSKDNSLWAFSHLAVFYVSICTSIFGFNISGISKTISGSLQNIWVSIFVLVYGAIGFMPLILDIPKNVLVYLLLGGFMGGVVFFRIYSVTTAQKYNLYLEQEKKQKDFFDKLETKKSEIKMEISYKRNCPEYDKTMDLITNAKSIEEVKRIYNIWINYEKSHFFCSICGTEQKDDAKYCNHCYVSLEHPYPICPECGTRINYSNNKICRNCGFDWFKFLEDKLNNKEAYDVSLFEISSKRLYKEGYFQSGYITDDVYKYVNNDYEHISSYNASYEQGIVHYKKNEQNYFFLYSPKLFNETHQLYLEKQKEQTEVEKRKAEEIKLHKQEHARKISEQTGIILD